MRTNIIILKTLMVNLLPAILLAQLVKMKMTTPIPASNSKPDKVETSIGTMNYFDGVPAQGTVDRSYDFFLFAHKVINHNIRK
jgi:hypothetical protein